MCTRTRLLTTSLLALCIGAATADVPTGIPVFSDSLDIDNEYFPVIPGRYKVLAGSEGDGTPIFSVELYTGNTREFLVGGVPVLTAIQQEIEFEDGDLVEISTNYFAQSDEGSVYYFGEVVDNYEDGVIVDHGGSWLVGGATQPGDPASTANASGPALFMPADPELGDAWKPEDTPPVVEEFAVVLEEDLSIQTAAGSFDEVLHVRETGPVGSTSVGVKLYAPDVGVIVDGTRGEGYIRLIGSNI